MHISGFEFDMLPESCVSDILSFTSPVEACRSSVVSSTFRSAMESDSVWERFLPSDYREILSRLVNCVAFSSKKELFFHLCHPVLIDGVTKSFKLEKSSGKKSYILSARELFIAWSDFPGFWYWVPKTESRFSDVAVLRTTSWLEIQGKIRTQMLSPNTNYGAYLITKISDHAYGLDSMPSETSVQVADQVSSSITYLCKHHNKKQQTCLDNINQVKLLETEIKDTHCQMLKERDDKWTEIELGEFFSGECDKEVKMTLREVKGCHLKGGLVIEGIEVRPK